MDLLIEFPRIVYLKRFLSKNRKRSFLLFLEIINNTEFSNIIEGKAVIFSLKWKEQRKMCRGMMFLIDKIELPFHPKMENQFPIIRKMEKKILSSPREGKNLFSF